MLTSILFLFSANMSDASRTAWHNQIRAAFTGDYSLSVYEDDNHDFANTRANFPERRIPKEILDYCDNAGVDYTRRVRLGGYFVDRYTGEFAGRKIQTIIGTDIARELARLTNLNIIEGKFDPSVENGVMVWKKTADYLGVITGNELTLYLKDVDNQSYPLTFQVTGVLTEKRNTDLEGRQGYEPVFPFILADRSYISRTLGIEDDECLEITVWDAAGLHISGLKRLASKYKLSFFRAEESYSLLEGIVGIIRVIGNFLGFIVLIILFVSLLNLNLMSYFERQKEIGAMTAIGAKPIWISSLILTEMFIFSLTVFIISLLFYSALQFLFPNGTDFGFFKPGFAGGTFHFYLLTQAVLATYVSILITILCSIVYPAYLVWKIQPVDIFREVEL